MGKRSDFPRRAQDAYDTPAEAVLPLLPHLPTYRLRFWEPCAGVGALVDTIWEHRPDAECVKWSDIEPRNTCHYSIEAADALKSECPYDAEYIITNPPWTRQILHLMIEHFSDMRPTWLLFDADWVHTKQAIPYLPRLRKIVSVGRVKWIKDSPHTGKDNCAWHMFTQPMDKPTEFYGRVG